MIIDTHTINSDIEEKNSISEKEEEPINEEDKITLEDLAPDGGWGWMIALAMILITFIIVGQASTFAIIFDDFLQDSGYAGTVTSIGNSIYAITYSIASVFTNILLKRYSLRLVGIAGVLFHVLPNIALAFISNVFQIPIISFFEGFGLGLIFTVTNTVFNSYFVKKRAKVMYASQVIIAFGGIIYPILSEKMLPIYGFREPYNFIYKTSAQRAMSFSSIESHGGAKSKFIWKSLSKRTSTISASSLVDLATHTTCTSSDIRQLHPEKKTNEKQTDKENREKKEKQNKEYKTILKDLVDMSLVKNFCFLNLCFGVNFVYYSDIGFIYLLPIIITDAGHSKDYAALSVTIIGIAELTAKILLSVFTLIINIKSKYIFFAATILMEFAKIGFLLCKHTLKGALITSALIGVVRSWLLVSQPLVIIEDLNIEKFASAYGINSVINCLVTIIFGAIVGIIRDWTDSYEIYQISLLVMNSVFILPWMLQFIFVDFRKWRKQRARKANIIDHWE
ncbi:Monocarboxylate transporter 9 [Trachymyrmex zeteki]|uniref:Monocarboxylate transporter 9 n=1 Tax=Mycetomoellerius zeteki TaxID=64791 RepID=A0A151X7L8_9HYME|nr:Monocarboxylate transporter 9 [Trachymyrmex zeteki]